MLIFKFALAEFDYCVRYRLTSVMHGVRSVHMELKKNLNTVALVSQKGTYCRSVLDELQIPVLSRK